MKSKNNKSREVMGRKQDGREGREWKKGGRVKELKINDDRYRKRTNGAPF